MNLIIRTGFGPVTHDIKFNPSAIPKGKALAISHVVRVEELRNENISHLIRCSVIPQTSVNAIPYKVQLHLSDKRHITCASCTCVSQAGRKCKHIYALIHYVNSNRSVTKTSLEQEWGRPSDKQLGHEMYAKPMRIANLFKSKAPETNCANSSVPLSLQLGDLKHSSALRIILKEYNVTQNERFVKEILLQYIYLAIEFSDINNCDACIINLLNFCEDHLVYSSNYIIADEVLKAFYAREVNLGETQIIQICVDTRGQSYSDKWFSVRNIRISASSRAHSIKTRQSEKIDALVNKFLTPSCINGQAKKNTQYGSKNEGKALKEYEAIHGAKVIQIGVVVSKTQPWLCASPDGVVIEDDCITKLVEIKCPVSCEKLPVVDFHSYKINVKYLYYWNGNIELKKSHQYYTQCQIQLYVTGLTVCDLYVWSPKGSCVVSVHRDEDFLKFLIPKLEKFYFQHFLEAIVRSDNNNNV
ncbi:uncharacterized protein [Temnothorax nylanderi]|uniref:uncharacterized protein n=1 Tax=Temnothorax nylanderi TaxID=102681 RepID=UPI003A85135F